MFKHFLNTRQFIFMFACATLASASGHSQETLLPQLSVSGTGEVTANPDMASVTFNLSQRSQQAAQAKKLVDTQASNLMKLARKLKIADKDIHAARLSVFPEYDYKRDRQLLGYRVTRDITFKLRNLDNYARLLEDAIGIGAIHNGNLVLGFSDQTSLDRKSMLLAFDDAKAKAEMLAKQAGGSLGRATWISESETTYPSPPTLMRAQAIEAADASYPTGALDLKNTVRVRFELVYD